MMMPRRLTTTVTLVLFTLVLAQPALALDVQVGQWVQLKATSPQGVPVHSQASPSMTGRLPEGTLAQIVELAEGGHWLRLMVEGASAGWIIERYVARVVPGPTPPAGSDPADEAAVWGSAAGCQQVVVQGRRAAPTSPDKLRMGSWNIRWFPDETNVPWLACAIAWMNLDILTLVEIRNTPEAQAAMTQLLLLLASFNGGQWMIDLHQCGPANMQHVGFLWNGTRATLSNQTDLWAFNARATPTGSPCANSLRPGRYARVKGTGANGVDFHAVAVHLKSGSNPSARAERVAVVGRLDTATASMRQTDEDVIILGDMNTMGDGTSGSATAELNDFATATAAKGFVRLTVAPACTEYFQGHGGWLDHVLVSRTMAELDQAAPVRMTGYCALKQCANIGTEKPTAYRELSDHCPIMFEVSNASVD
jgi:endonuclease/exonuclease/phosphatase family metal-dependent hydrolase